MELEDRNDCYFFSAKAIAALPEQRNVHQFNDNAVRITRTLGTLAGLTQIGLHIVRLEKDRDSTEYHYHDADEEFLYVISGRGFAVIGDERHDVGPGDVMAFPHGSPPHTLSNPFEEDLVYLMGGERNSSDVVHYPNLKRSMVKSAGRRHWTDWSNQSEI